MNLKRNFRRDQTGATAVEFAVLAPIFLLLIAGIINIGMAVNWRVSAETRISAMSNYIINQALNEKLTTENLAEAVAIFSQTPISYYGSENELYSYEPIIEDSSPTYVKLSIQNNSPFTLIPGYNFSLSGIKVTSHFRIN